MSKQKLIEINNNIVTVKNEIQTDIFNGSTSEFFINMNPKDIPPKNHEDRGDFVRREKLKCKQGININGVPITGRLYYHLNFHKIALDAKIGNDIERVIGNPLLRDNEWMIFNAYEECLKGDVEHDYKKQAFMIGGGRQISKSDSMCSMSLYALNLFDNPEAVLLFTNSADKQTYTKKAQLALTHGESFIMRPTIDNNWTKTEIRFGLTNKDNTTNVIGRLYMYNTAGDNAPQIASGKSISFFAYDEALKHGSSIYYEDRIGKIEDVKVGDRIYGQDGKLTTVEEVLPQGITEIYKMTLRDGRIVETSPNHLWDVLDIGTKTHKTLTTEQIFKTNNGSQIDKRYNKIVKKQRYFIPKNGVVEYPEKEVFVEPYYLGLWLGDGASTAVGSIANIDEPILEYLKEYANRLGGEFHSYTYKNHTIRFKNVKRLGDRKTSLRKLFDIYNLYDNKHIPNEYLFNSYDIRMELLKGLGDSDGTVYKDGHIEFSNTNFVLIQQVAQLIRSLGINCSLSTPKKAGYKKDGVFVRCKDSYKISIRTTIPIFKLERKLNNYNISTNLKKKSFEDYTSIVKVEKAEDAYSTCIRVDNENSLFLTNDFIVTHNCAKDSYRRSYEAVLPALVTPYGWRCAPILAFTGGDVQKSQDAEDMFMNPEGANVRAFPNEGKKTGFFMGGWYRQDFKYPVVFTEYLNRNGYIVPKGSELDDMKILVTDFNKANQILDEEIVAAGKSKDPTALLEKKMFFPRTIKEMFLKNLTSNFKSEYINQQREYIKSGSVDVTAVELFRDLRNGEVKHKLSSKPFVNDWKNPGYSADAAIKVFDFPKYTSYGVHVIGCLPPDEKVMTQKGLMNIQEVSLEDKLINEKGDLVEIKNLQNYLVKDEDLYELTLGSTCRTTKFTKEHPILISKNKTKWISKIRQQREGLKQRYKDFNFSYKPVSEAEVGDWIKVPNVYRKSSDFDYRKLWDDIDCRNCNKLTNPMDSKDFWWLVGLFLGDGWCDKQRVSFAFNRKEIYYIEKFKLVIKELFDKENTSIKERIGSIELYIFSVKLHMFLTSNFGKYASGKYIPEWVKYLKPEFKEELLRGYLNSDGCVGFNKQYHTLSTEFVSINLEMLESFQDILFSLGFTSSLKMLRGEKIHTFGEKKCPTKKCYTLHLAHYESEKFLTSIFDEEDPKISKVLGAGIHQKAGKKYCFFSDDLQYMYFKIKKIDKSKYSGWVYNFECDTNTFMCHHITTHNCDPYREDEVGSSNSLGYVTVLRRNHSDLTDNFRGKQVASYLGRTKTVKDFHQMILDLAEYYNAQILYEHSDRDLLSFFENKHKTHLLMDTVPLQREINVLTKTKNAKGLRPTVTNKKFLINSTLGWVNDELEDDTLGYAKIFDDILLQQLEAYDPDENLDAYIGFSHAVAAYNYFEKFGTPVVTLNNKIEEKKKTPPIIKNAFGMSFKHKPKNAFGI